MSVIFCLGEFELDTLRFELRRHGIAVSVQPKVLRLLFHLVEHRDRSVSAAELLDALWPGEAVTAASVKRAIAGARRALGERSEADSRIRTVRGHGYRFVGEVQPRVAGPERSVPPSAAARARDAGLFSREDDLATFERVLAAAASGEAQSVLLEGTPGSGKSTMLRELGRRAGERGALTLGVRCPSTYVPALWPIFHLLREVAHEIEPRLLREFQPLPELTLDPPDERELYRRSHAFLGLIRQVSQSRLVVLAFDDLHYADAGTLQLLATGLPQLDRARVVVAAAMRPLLARDRPQLSAAAAALSQTRIELRALTALELTRWRTQSLPEVALGSLHDWTAGNLRACDHVIRWLSSGGELDVTSCATGSGAGALLERQLGSLERPARELLQIAAVLGRDFSLAVLGRAAALSPSEVSARLGDALRLGIVEERSERQHRFAAALVREALYLQLSRVERSRLHARVASALEAEGGEADPAHLAVIAEHYARATPHDGGRAYQYAAEAARGAMNRGAYEQAVQCLDRALECAPLAEAGARLQLSLAKAEALVGLGLVDRAADAAASAARLARESNDSDGLVQAARLLGRLPLANDAEPSQRALLEGALAALPPDDPRRPGIQALLARAHVWSRDPSLRAARATAAFAAARGIADPAERGEALRACLHALADPEFLPERLAIAEELEVIGRALEDRGLLVTSAIARVWAECERGDMPGVDANIHALEVLARHTNDPFARWHAEAYRAMRAIVAGRLEAAGSHARAALALGSKLARANAQHVYATQMGGILRLEGRLEEAAELVREVSLRHPAIAGWQAALASIEAELGRVDHARAVLDRLLDRNMVALLGDPYGLGALAPAADLCASVGDADQARRLYPLLLPYADRHGVISTGTNTHGPLSRHLGRLALRMGELETAEQHFVCAIEAAERCASPTFASLGYLAYAQLWLQLNRRGARERAAALTARALRIGHEYELRIVVERARTLARRGHLRLVEPRARARAGAS